MVDTAHTWNTDIQRISNQKAWHITFHGTFRYMCSAAAMISRDMHPGPRRCSVRVFLSSVFMLMLRIGTQPSIFPLTFVVQTNLQALNVACSCAERYQDASLSGKAPFSGHQISIKPGHPAQVMLTGQALSNFILFCLPDRHRTVHILTDASNLRPALHGTD